MVCVVHYISMICMCCAWKIMFRYIIFYNLYHDDEADSPGSMNLLNCMIYQRGRVSSVADTELMLLIAHLNPTIRLNSFCRKSYSRTKSTYFF